MAKSIQYITYTRKSTDEETRQVTSLDAQTRELRDFAKRDRLPVKEVINTLELAGKSQTAKSPQEISLVVHKVGTNRLLSRKTVTFSFSEPYAFIPSLLASRHASTANTSPSLGDENLQSLVWCSRLESPAPLVAPSRSSGWAPPRHLACWLDMAPAFDSNLWKHPKEKARLRTPFLLSVLPVGIEPTSTA